MTLNSDLDLESVYSSHRFCILSHSEEYLGENQ